MQFLRKICFPCGLTLGRHSKSQVAQSFLKPFFKSGSHVTSKLQNPCGLVNKCNRDILNAVTNDTLWFVLSCASLIHQGRIPIWATMTIVIILLVRTNHRVRVRRSGSEQVG
jgi:hypothetical protein